MIALNYDDERANNWVNRNALADSKNFDSHTNYLNSFQYKASYFSAMGKNSDEQTG